MNTTLSTAPGRHDHPPHESEQYQPNLPRRVSPLDRLALHVGVALIKWGRRPKPVESRERRANRVELELARLARESSTERSIRLSTPVR
ncbi:MAG: hypothetical protein JWQ39_3040 [Glaciihabitans sp.]|jgi:hypothetical protein|nr:hypothetical protein [Glaciihabitans sp.]